MANNEDVKSVDQQIIDAKAAVAASKDKLTSLTKEKDDSLPDGWNNTSVYITSGGVMGFSLIIIVIMALLIYKKCASAAVILRTFTIPLIAVLAVLLIIVGYTQQQIAPAMGLLGTIAGYLLGKNEGKEKHEAD